LQTRRWEDKEGQKHTNVEVVANEMMMLGDRKDNNQDSQGEKQDEETSEPLADEDEFPF
jgi:single-strand DNA-binding protein